MASNTHKTSASSGGQTSGKGSDHVSGAPKAMRSSAKASEQKATGQKASSERGVATNNKKNPGKRAHQGGNAR
jgi:hypothetical protein